MATAILFPGQGSQYVGMGSERYEQSPSARRLFDEADAVLGYALSQLCFEGPEEKLTETVYQQPALFVTSLASWAAYQEQEPAPPAPAFMAGHSLGELTALVAAGSLTFADGLALVQRRGELMAQAGEAQPGAMAALLALDLEAVQAVCRRASTNGHSVQVANDNCPGQIVISGHEAALTAAMEYASEAGARRVVRLPISIAAHSSLMQPVAEAFAAAVDAVSIQSPRVPVVGNTTAAPLADPAAVRAELKAQLTSAVNWTGTVRYMLDHGVDTFVEVGPGDVLLGLVKRIDRRAQRVSFE